MPADRGEHAATPRRQEQAREKGQRWRSPDASMAVSLLVGIGGLLWTGPWIAVRCLSLLHASVSGPWPTLRGANWTMVADRAVVTWVSAVLPVLVGLFVAGAAAGWALNGFRFGGPWRLQWQRLNPIAAFTHMFSRSSFADLGRRVITVITLTAAAVLAGWVEGPRWIELAGVPAIALPALLAGLLWPVWMAATAVFVLWAVLDIVVQARRFQQQLKMSDQDLKDETRDTEGDPRWRARRKAAAQQGLKRAAQSVQDAAVLLVNPTHAAVALAWDPGQDTPPTVAAKGVDETAAVLRGLAAEAGVPIVSDPPLTWALMTVPIGDPVPPDHWQAVALVLASIIKRRQRPAAAVL